MKKKLPILLTLILTLVLCVCGLFACENTNLLGNGNGTNVEGDAGSGENDGGNNNEGTGSGESGSGENNQQQEVDWNLVYTVEGNEITGLTPYGRTLTQLAIPNEINGANITNIGFYAFYGCDSLTSVTIGSGVQSIGSYAFSRCTALTSIEIPNSVTSIGGDAFRNCTALEKVNYLGTIDSWAQIEFDYNANPLGNGADLYINGVKQTDITINAQTIKEYAFYNCTSLSSVTIGENVQSIGDYAFYGYTAIEKVNYLGNIDSWAQIEFSDSTANPLCNSADLYINGVKQTEITINPQFINDYAFYNCKSLTSVIIEESVQSIGNSAFYNCTAIEEINFNATNCADLSENNYVFAYAGKNGNGIKVTFGNSVTHIPAYLFCLYVYSPKITSVTIGSGVQSIGDFAFAHCTSLTSITIPNNVQSIGSCVFYNCTAIEEINFNATNCADLSKDNHVFSNAGKNGNGIKVTFGNSVTHIPAYLFYPYRYDASYSPKITSVTIGSGVQSIGSSAFAGCDSLTKVTIGENVKSIGNYAFDWCTAIEEINFNATNCADLSYDNYVFYNAGKGGNGIKVTFGNNVTHIPAYLFYPYGSSFSPKITSVTIGSGVQSIGEHAFAYCDSLTSVTIGNSVQSIGDYAFYKCYSLTSITIPNSVQSIGKAAFYGCYKLVEVINKSPSITIEKGADSNGDIGYYALKVFNSGDTYENKFTNDNGYIIYNNEAEKVLCRYEGTETNLTLPSYITAINNYAFYNCGSLTSVIIGNNVQSIGDRAFYWCESLTSTTIGSGVQSIGYYAFYNCTAIEEINFNAINCANLSEYNDVFYNAGKNGNGIKVTFGNSVTHIPAYLFYPDTYSDSYSPKITSVTIGSGVQSIGGDAFENCYKLVEVINKSPSITVEKGASSNGYVGYYALAVFNSGDTYENKFTNDNGYIIYNNEAEKVLCRYEGTETNLTLPSYITAINNYAFNYCASLRSIEIPNSVQSIGNYAFAYCRKLSSVTIGSGVQSIGDYAFTYCDSLTSITIPNSVQSIGVLAFLDCTRLTSIAVDENNSHYKSIDGNLYSKDGTILIQYAIGKTETTFIIPLGVTSIGDRAFYSCTKLTSITIPNSVQSIGFYAFRDCDSLTKVNYLGSIDSWAQISFEDNNANPLHYGADLYINSVKQTEITINAQTINTYAFNGCTSLTSVIIGENVQSIGSYAFRGCGSLTSVTIGSGVQSIGYDAFRNCTALEEINFNATNCADLSYDNYVFYNAGKNGNGIKVTFGNSVTHIPAHLFYPYRYDTSCSPKIIRVTIGSGVQSIGEYAFSDCASLTSIEIPNSVKSIGMNAFADCTSLKSVIIGNNVQSIGHGAFRDCTALTSIEIPNSVTSIGGEAFRNCTALTIIEIPNSVQSIGALAFCWCTSLTSVSIGSGVQSIGDDAFYYCTALTSVTIGNSVQSIGSSAFENCYSLEKVNYLGTIDSWVQISFEYYDSNPLCNGADLYINDVKQTEITINAQTINKYAFYNYTSLTSVTIGSGVQSICYYAFNYCTSLKSVTIGNNVQSIAPCVFAYCTSLTSIYFNDTSTWYRTTNESHWLRKTGGTETSVTNSSTNATNFKSTYNDYYWYKI